MIQIAVNSAFLDVAKGFSIPMEEAFGFDEFLSVPGEKSWKFTVPKTPNNRQIFGFADVPEVVWSPQTSYPCTLHIAGRVFKSGKLYIEEDSATDFAVYFVGTVGVLGEILNGIKLPELEQWPVVSGIADMFDYAKTVASNPAAPVVFFNVYMPRNTFPYVFMNDEDPDRETTGNWEGFNAVGTTLLTPFVHLRRLWEVLLGEYGFIFESDFLADAEINSLVFFNTKPLNLLDSSGDFTQNYPTTIDCKNHVPDVTVQEFLTEFSKLFNLFITYNDVTNTVSIIPRKEFLSAPRVGFIGKLIDYNTLFEKTKTYSLRYTVDEDDKTISPDWTGSLEGINGPVGSEVIESGIGTLPMWNKLGDGDLYVPVSSAKYGDDVGVKLLFYRGLQNTYTVDPSWGPIPHGSCDLGYTTGFNYTLLWKDAGGLDEVFWRPWLDAMLTARTLKLTLKLSEADLLAFDAQKVHVIEGWKCFVKKLEYDLGEEEVIATAEVLKF